VREAVVQLREDTPGNPRLVAYIVPQGEAPTTADLRTALRQQLPDYMIPVAFMPLPALPLTPNGKIDRKALPAPSIESHDDQSHPMQPRDNIERHLVRIWEILLKRQSIGVNDNFFDLGGHSLLAVQLMDQIERTFHRRLPLDSLWFRGGTVQTLAAIIRDEYQSGANPELVLIKGGARRPLFVMHTTGGNLFHYYELSRQLNADQAVYGLQARGVFGAGRPDQTIEAIAGHCIEAMRTAQPKGPYLLAGFSSGGVIAFEVAQQLSATGEQVALLALLDTYAPQAMTVKQWSIKLGELMRNRANLRQIQELAYYWVLHRFKLDGLRELRNVGEAHRWAHWSYRPRPYTHPIEFFMAKDSADRAGAEVLGWARWAKDSVRIHRLPGSHGHLVKPPVVEELAARLQACLDHATDN
jgi:thioesterase domain-containing protein/acyl carrier protein